MYAKWRRQVLKGETSKYLDALIDISKQVVRQGKVTGKFNMVLPAIQPTCFRNSFSDHVHDGDSSNVQET